MTSTEMTMTTTKMAQKKVVVGHSFKIMEVKVFQCHVSHKVAQSTASDRALLTYTRFG
jgi:hypothetical protein